MQYDKKAKTLTIEEYGVQISKNLDYLVIKNKENKTRFLAPKIKKIIILNDFSITKSAILLCMFNDIRIMALSRHGSPLFTIFSLRTEDKFLQLLTRQLVMKERQRTNISRIIVENTIKGKLTFLRYKKGIFRRTNPEKAEKIVAVEERLMQLWKEAKHIKGKWSEKKKDLLSIESHAANLYFSCLSIIFDKSVYKGKRDKNANDLLNICLNYAYGILKYYIFYKLIDSGINPFNSIYHYQKDKTKMFLVFDLMEGLRHTVCDWSIHSLINRKIIKPSNIDNGVGKDFLIIEKRIEIVNAVKDRLKKEENKLNKIIKIILSLS